MAKARAFYGWKLLFVLWLVSIASISLPTFGSSVITPYLAADLHFNRSTMGLGFALLQWISGILGPIVALSVTKKGVRFTLTAGTMLALLGSILMVRIVHTSLQFYIVFGVIVGLGVVGAGPVVSQTAVSRWFVKRRALAISLLLAAPPVGGFVAAPLLNRLIATSGNWRTAWLSIAICNFIAMLLAIFFVKESPADLGQFPDGAESAVAAGPEDGQMQRKGGVFRTSTDWSPKEALSSPTLWLLVFCTLGLSMGWGVFMTHGVIHLKDLGHAPDIAALVFSLALVATIVGNFIASLGDRVEPRFLLSGASLFFAVGMILLLKATAPVFLYGFPVFIGIGFGCALGCLMTIPANYFGIRAYPALVGIIASVQTTASAIGSYASGYAYDHFGGYSKPFYAIALLSLLSAGFCLALKPPDLRSPRSPARAVGTVQ